MAFTIAASQGALLFGLNFNNEITTFESTDPTNVLGVATISGTAGEFITDFTYNSNDGNFYGIGDSANIYRISRSGAATLINSSFFPIGFDLALAYDPVSNSILGGSDVGEHFSFTPGGALTLLGDFAYDATDLNAGTSPSIVGLGIDPFTGEIFSLDSATGVLAISDFFDTSVLVTIGELGFAITGNSDLAVFGDAAGQTLFGALSTDGLTDELYEIDAFTGAATRLGALPAGTIGIAAIPEPTSSLLLVLSGLGICFFRRR